MQDEVKRAARAAVNMWGAEAQVRKAVEELAELQVELLHYLCGRGDYQHIAEEIADVMIMLEQLRLIYQNENSVNLWLDIKSRKLIERIENYGKHRDPGTRVPAADKQE